MQAEANAQRLYKMAFSSVYPLYIAKVERKGRTKDDVDQAICWLTGYSPEQLESQLEAQVSFQDFFDQAPSLSPRAELITGTICGVKIEAIESPLMKKIRWLDKLVDEIAKGRPLEKVFR